MKKFLLLNVLFLFLIILSLAACKNRKQQDRQIELLTDSAAFNNSPASDSAAILSSSDSDVTPKTNTYPVNNNNAPKAVAPEVTEATAPSSSASASQANSGQGPAEKKGWSEGAKGAVIGGAAGAVGGAIISKKKGAGAAVGAAVGAGAGYIIGHEKDKKSGRAKKK